MRNDNSNQSEIQVTLNWPGKRVLLDQGLGQLVALRLVRAAVGSINPGFFGVNLFFGEPRVQQLRQLEAAALLQQLDLKFRFI